MRIMSRQEAINYRGYLCPINYRGFKPSLKNERELGDEYNDCPCLGRDFPISLIPIHISETLGDVLKLKSEISPVVSHSLVTLLSSLSLHR